MVSPFVWQQGKWANAPAGDVPIPTLPLPPFPLFRPSSCPTVLLVVSLSLLCRRTGRRGQIQSDLAMICLGWLIHGPSHGSLLVLASRLSTRMQPCCRPRTSTSMPNTSFNWWSSHMASFSSSPCGWRTRTRPTLVDHLHYIGLSPATPSIREQWPLVFHTCDPLSVPSWQMTDGSMVTVLASLMLSFFLLEHFGGWRTVPATRPSLRAPLLVRLLLVLLSQYLPSRVSAPIRYGWYCGWWQCSKVPVSSSFFGSLLDSPFFVLWQFPCWAPSLLAAVVSPFSRS